MNRFKQIIDDALQDIRLFKTIEKDDKLYVSISNSKEWTVELSYSILKESYEQNSFKRDLLMKEIVKAFMKMFDIAINNTPIAIIEKPRQTIESRKFDRKLNELKSPVNPPIIVVEGDERCGKTILVEQYWNSLIEERAGTVFWLDFNGGGNDFRDIISNILLSFNSNDRKFFIVLDNLQCCGYTESKNIFRFFTSFVRLLNSDGNINLKLVLIQNRNRRICLKKEFENEWAGFISLAKEDVIKDLNIDTDQREDLFLLLNRSHNNLASNFIKVHERWDEQKSRLFFKLLVLCKFDIEITLDEKEKQTAISLINDVEGLKVTQDKAYRAKLLNGKLCALLLDNIGSTFGTEIGIANYIANNFNNIDEAVNKIVNDYLSKNQLTLDETSSIMKQNAYFYYSQWDKSKKYMDFLELLDYAKQHEQNIIREIQSSSSKNSYFGNHLGSILFAAETLCFYPNDWEALAAWDRLSEYVNDTFYIDGQKLPEIKYGKETNEKTSDDFCCGTDNNSIENQIGLQDKVIEEYGINILNIPNLEEKNFQYLLTNAQHSIRENIDMNRFYQTYILALLFEFEVRAPQCRYNKTRVQKLYRKITKNIIINNDKNNDKAYAYFYPARVPWVSARMLLAFSMISNNTIGLSYEEIRTISAYQKLLTQYLIDFSYSFKYNDHTYRIWLPGTGRWNGILETTMMCTFALKRANANTKYIEEGELYIKDMQNCWYSHSSIADGMWAIETLNLNKNTNQDNVLDKASSIWDKLKEILTISTLSDTDMPDSSLSTGQSSKNDKSLGSSHIAQTLNSLVFELVKHRPPIYFDYKETKTMAKKQKVFISFDTKTGLKYAEKLYEDLLSKEVFQPYFYRETMRQGKWHAQLKNAILMSDSFILVLGKETLSSNGVIYEIKNRLEDEKPILPLVYGTKEDLEEIRNYVDSIEALNSYQKDELKQCLNPHINNIVYLDKPNYLKKIFDYLKPLDS